MIDSKSMFDLNKETRRAMTIFHSTRGVTSSINWLANRVLKNSEENKLLRSRALHHL